MLAAQSILHCVPNGCYGGDADHVHMYIYRHGIPVDTCQNYIAIGSGTECTPEHICMNCSPDGNCSAVSTYPKVWIKEFGALSGVEAMKAEIVARGPIACQVDSGPISKWGFGPNRTKIFTGGVGHDSADHEISVVGFGYDAGEAMSYWIIRNSWGEYWGEFGYFRVQLGTNQIGLESNTCSWAVPSDVL
jgi:cathepsin X